MNITGSKLRETFNLAAHQPVGWHDGFFTNQYHHRLRYGFAPASGEVKGSIVLTHGYGEFIDQYFLAIREFQSMGYNVWAMDHYGFGKSGRDDPENPHRPSTKGMLRHVNDLDFFVRNIVTRPDGTPLILNTHSMGGHIGLLYLQRHPKIFDGAIMSSPMFDIFRFGMPLATRPLLRAVFNVASLIGLRNTEVPATPAMWDKVTRVSNTLTMIDPAHTDLRAVFKQLAQGAMQDILISRPTFGWISAAFTTIVRSMKSRELAKVETPLLIGSAGIESLVDTSAHERAARFIPDARLVKLPNAGHNLWFETDGDYKQWLDHIRIFLSKIGAAFPAPPGNPENGVPVTESGPKTLIRAAFCPPPAPIKPNSQP